MSRPTRLLAWVLSAAMLGAASPAPAFPVEFGFTGVVTAEDALFPVGTQISGSYFFESVPTSVSTLPGLARYRPVYSVSGSVGVVPFAFAPETPTSGFITVSDVSAGGGTDSYQFQLMGGTPGSFTLTLEDDDGVMLSNVDLPLAPPTLSFAERATFSIRFEEDESTSGDITSLFLIPEPSVGVLLALGVAGLIALRRG